MSDFSTSYVVNMAINTIYPIIYAGVAGGVTVAICQVAKQNFPHNAHAVKGAIFTAVALGSCAAAVNSGFLSVTAMNYLRMIVVTVVSPVALVGGLVGLFGSVALVASAVGGAALGMAASGY